MDQRGPSAVLELTFCRGSRIEAKLTICRSEELSENGDRRLWAGVMGGGGVRRASREATLAWRPEIGAGACSPGAGVPGLGAFLSCQGPAEAR